MASAASASASASVGAARRNSMRCALMARGEGGPDCAASFQLAREGASGTLRATLLKSCRSSAATDGRALCRSSGSVGEAAAAEAADVPRTDLADLKDTSPAGAIAAPPAAATCSGNPNAASASSSSASSGGSSSASSVPNPSEVLSRSSDEEESDEAMLARLMDPGPPGTPLAGATALTATPGPA